MPLPTPFHPRTSALCTSLRWKEWAGYHAVCSYGVHHDPEYYAVRHSAGLLDVSPLHKLRVRGPDAAAFLSYVTARDISRLKLGQVGYGCWCDDDGKLLDDGTVTRWDDQDFRLTSADPCWGWLNRHTQGFDVRIDDVSTELAALALQGPRAREILTAVCGGELAELRFFRAARARCANFDIEVTRTGYTGDLGYELWVAPDHALALWDALMEAGAPHAMLPLGLDALDVTRIEAGFILAGVDYTSARRALIPARKSSPFEVGLGWTVQTERELFLGQAALVAERSKGSAWSLVGLEIDWDELEALYDSFGLPPSLCSMAWRDAVPVYLDDGRQVGQATSGTWSPTLKQNLALASVRTPHAKPGARLKLEVTVEYQRRKVTATIVPTPFFDPPRKRGKAPADNVPATDAPIDTAPATPPTHGDPS
ncbi:MAG: aminomethyl transferase family protein [Planctomycetota bacterium]|nr:MAG: aminomethyl transferase family protein [Planctomycetota bacterium]